MAASRWGKSLLGLSARRRIGGHDLAAAEDRYAELKARLGDRVTPFTVV